MGEIYFQAGPEPKVMGSMTQEKFLAVFAKAFQGRGVFGNPSTNKRKPKSRL
jgi:hypothetical protein